MTLVSGCFWMTAERTRMVITIKQNDDGVQRRNRGRVLRAEAGGFLGSRRGSIVDRERYGLVRVFCKSHFFGLKTKCTIYRNRYKEHLIKVGILI